MQAEHVVTRGGGLRMERTREEERREWAEEPMKYTNPQMQD